MEVCIDEILSDEHEILMIEETKTYGGIADI